MGTSRIKSTLLKVSGYLIFLVQSVPIWTGLMTLPFAAYLFTILRNISVNLPIAISEFSSPFLITEKILITIGLVIIIYSTIHLQITKRKGLVTSGPYGIVRHPQYLGMIITTIGLTSWSIWWLRNTFGIGFLNPSQTVALWSMELFAYIFLAIIEELHLKGIFNGSYEKYSAQVPFFIPFFSVEGRIQEVITSILIPTVILFGLLWMHAPMQ